jgi:hypothetical protein
MCGEASLWRQAILISSDQDRTTLSSAEAGGPRRKAMDIAAFRIWKLPTCNARTLPTSFKSIHRLPYDE